MATITFARMKQLRDTAENWLFANPILLEGELGVESDTNALKVGDGETPWNELPYVTGGGGPGDSPVDSVFGRVGNIVALFGDYRADQVLAENNLSNVQEELDNRGKLLVDNTWSFTNTFNDTVTLGNVSVTQDGVSDIGDENLKHKEIFAVQFNEDGQPLAERYLTSETATVIPGEGIYTLGNISTGVKIATDVASGMGIGYEGEGDSRQLRLDLRNLPVRSNAIIDDGLVMRSAVDETVFGITLDNMLGGYLGPLKIRGVWDPSTNTVIGDGPPEDPLNTELTKGVAPNAPSGTDPAGFTYICNNDGAFDLTDQPGEENWKQGDKAVWTGSAWVLVPRPPDAVFSVFGREGDILAEYDDYGAGLISTIQRGGIVATNVQVALEDLERDKVETITEISADNGLVGGGDLSTNVSLSVGEGVGISVTADLVNLDLTYTDARYGRLTLPNTWTDINTFQGAVIVPNSSLGTHALNNATADARYGRLALANIWIGANTYEQICTFNEICTFNGTNTFNGACIFEANNTHRGSSTFTGNVIVPNSTTNTHALNTATADGRYGRLVFNNTWGSNNTFNGNVIVPNSTTSTHALNTGTADGRYGRLAGDNTWTGNNTFNGQVTAPNLAKTQTPNLIYSGLPPTTVNQQVNVQTGHANRLVFVNFAIHRHGSNQGFPQAWWLGSTLYSPVGEEYANMSQGRDDSSSRRHLPSGQIAVKTDSSGNIRLKCLIYSGSTSGQTDLHMSIETYI